MIFICIPRLNLYPICCGFELDACSVDYTMVSVFAASCLVMCLVRVLSKNCTPGLLCEASVIQSIHFRISPLTKPCQHNRRPSCCHRRSGLGQAQHINKEYWFAKANPELSAQRGCHAQNKTYFLCSNHLLCMLQQHDPDSCDTAACKQFYYLHVQLHQCFWATWSGRSNCRNNTIISSLGCR